MKEVYITRYFLILVVFTFCLSLRPVHAQWNPNPGVNMLFSTLKVADMKTMATSNNRIWVAYYALESGNYNMYAQLLTAEGVKLLGDNGFLVSNQPSGSAIFVFNICLDSAGSVIIGCQDQRSGSNQCVMYKVSQAGAHVWSPAGVVLGTGLSPYATELTTGEVIVAFNATTGSTLNLQKIKTDGTTAWATPKSVLVGTTKTTRGQVLPSSNGGFNMVFQKKGVGVSSTLYAQRYDSAGASQYTAVQFSTLTASSARYYSVLADADTVFVGEFVASGSRFNSYLQRINPDGTLPWGNNGSNFCTAITSSDPYQMLTNITRAAGSPYIWSVCNFTNSSQSNYGIYVQKFNKFTGARMFGDAAKNLFPISASRDQHDGGIVSVDDDQLMFMQYDVNYKIYAARLDTSGNFVWAGNRVELSTTTAGGSTPKGRWGFAAAGPDKCAGFWYEDRGTGVGYMGYAQGITLSGFTGIRVYTQGNVPAEITERHGSLQVVDTIFPLAANQSVTWSIVPGTGSATITSSGLVSSESDGTVWAKAVAVIDSTLMDSLLITISGQSAPECNAPTGVTVSHILSSTALVTWLPTSPLPAAGYEYELRTSGEPGSGSPGLEASGILPSSPDSLLLTDLNGETVYFVYLRSNCGDEHVSVWTTGVTFTTIPVSIELAGTVSDSTANCYNATVTITVAGNGTTFTVTDGSSATLIAGANIHMLEGTTIMPGGYLHGYITETGEFCQVPANPLAGNDLPFSEVPQPMVPVKNTADPYTAWPNPTSGRITIDKAGSQQAGTATTISVYTITGNVLITRLFESAEKMELSLEGVTPGIYFLSVSDGENRAVIKVVKW